MKKFLKLSFIIICLFAFSFFIYADKDDSGLNPKEAEQVRRAEEATTNYCAQNSEVKGCIFDENNSLYTEITSEELEENNIFPDGFVKSIPLRRGYVAFNGQGEAVFAGCYKYEYNINDYRDSNGNIVPTEFIDSNHTSDGTFYAFKIIRQKKGTCSYAFHFVVPAEGVYMSSNELVSNTVISTGYLEDYVYGSGDATMGHSWKATKNGECPLIFGYSANTNVFSSAYNTYYFTNNENEFIGHQSKNFLFIKGKKFVARPGCTEEDVAGEEEHERLLEEVSKKIKNMECPQTMEDMSQLGNDFDKWYKSFVDDNEYRSLYSKKYADELTLDKAKTRLRTEIKNKLVACQQKICNLTESETNKINNNRGTACKNGCSIKGVTSQANTEGAMCYLCVDNGSSSGATYRWLDLTNPLTKDPKCSSQPKKTQSQCIGTVENENCRQCLATSYKNAGLSDEKIKCLTDIEIQGELAERDLELKNSEAADESVEQEMAANEEIRDNMASGKFDPVELFFNEALSCKEVLGPVLTAIVKGIITIIQIAAAIIAIVKGMMILVPAVTSHNADALKKATKPLIMLAVILALVIVFRPIVKIIGSLLDYDITCIV